MTQEHLKHPARHHQYITSFSGHKISSLGVRPDQINRDDCLRGTAMQTRYLGQIIDFYSIAEHEVVVSLIAEHHGESTPVLQACLEHDGHEYITGDFPSPYKNDVSGLRAWEGQIEAVYREAMGLPPNKDPIWETVKLYDLIALHFEAKVLMARPPAWYDEELASQAPSWLRINCYDWRKAMSAYRTRALQIGLRY